jgi:hypothetical protein
MEEYDVLIWNSPKSELEDLKNPEGMVNVSDEYIGLNESEAYKVYNNAEFYYKQLIKYESSEPDADGDIIMEESI